MNPYGEKLKAILLKPGTMQSCSLSLYIFNIVLEVLPRTIRQLKAIYGLQIEKEEITVALFADDIILYKKSINPTRKLLINTLNNVGG